MDQLLFLIPGKPDMIQVHTYNGGRMATPKKRLGDRLDDTPGFVKPEDVGTPLDPVTWYDRHPEKSDPRKSNANEKTFEDGETVIQVLVSAVVDLLTVGAIAPHRAAIRRHLSDRALDQAIQKLQSIRRD